MSRADDVIQMFTAGKLAAHNPGKTGNEQNPSTRSRSISLAPARQSPPAPAGCWKGCDGIAQAHQDFVAPAAKIPGQRTDNRTR